MFSVVLGPPEAPSLSLRSKMEQQDFKQQSEETRRDNSCLWSRFQEAGTWHSARIPLARTEAHDHTELRGSLGNVASVLRGPLCPATNSMTMRRGGSGSWDTSHASCRTATAPWPAAHRLVRSRDSFPYVRSQLSLNKCLLKSVERRWEMGPSFVWRWQRTQSSCFRNSRGTS